VLRRRLLFLVLTDQSPQVPFADHPELAVLDDGGGEESIGAEQHGEQRDARGPQVDGVPVERFVAEELGGDGLGVGRAGGLRLDHARRPAPGIGRDPDRAGQVHDDAPVPLQEHVLQVQVAVAQPDALEGGESLE
jgi:hypothetical protein